jgi:uncharacterized protein (DUF1330 family)
MARLYIIMLVWLKPGGEQALHTFREQAAHLWQHHDVRVERVLTGTGKGQLIGANPHDVPDLLQVVSVPSLEAFRAYTTSPEYVRLAEARDRGIARMVAVLGPALDVSAYNPESRSALGARQYGVAFARFHPGGAEAMDAFNRQANALYVRHGMHVEAMVHVAKTLTPVGTALEDFAPERVVVFFLDDAAALKAYVTDPEYMTLAPLRDRGLRSYDFFLARSPR